MSTPLYLLDTNIVSDAMRHPFGAVAQRILAQRPDDANIFAISMVVQCELLYGLARKSSPRLQTAYDTYLPSLRVLPLDDTVPPHYAALRAHLEAQGQPIGPNDALIAAHALALGATLVSGDDEFARVPGLKVENWLQPRETT
ncbi:MAG: PIN domain-containing protein [Pseudomonadota bacterium]|nr:PIN domain-containing protein [Pseudomonadota bacterium]